MISNYPTGTNPSDFEPARCPSCRAYHDTEAEEDYCCGLGNSVAVVYDLIDSKASDFSRAVKNYFDSNPGYFMKDELPEGVTWNDDDEVCASQLTPATQKTKVDLETVDYRLKLITAQIGVLSATVENISYQLAKLREDKKIIW